MKVVSAKIIDGKQTSLTVLAEVKAAAAEFCATTGIQPGIAVVIVGDDAASKVYVKAKGRAARDCGFLSFEHSLPAHTDVGTLVSLIDRLNRDPAIHGILVQLPLPPHVDADHVTQLISAAKDVDGFNFTNVGKVSAGSITRALVPCTPAGCMRLITDVLGSDLSGQNAVVVGRSNIVGKPLANLLLAANATVTIAHSRSRDLPALCRTADILVAAVGRPQMISGDWIKPGAVVIDVGINRISAPEKGVDQTRLVGDVDYPAVARVASAVTPVPGGVGPMTIAFLMKNTLDAARRAHQ